jgi:subtilisin
MKTKLSIQQYILMPVRGFRAIQPFSSPSVVNFLTSIARVGRVHAQAFGKKKAGPLKMRVLDSIHEDGPKLVELLPDEAITLRAHQPSVKLVPVVYYRTAVAPRWRIKSRPKAAAEKAAVKITLKVVSKKEAAPISGASVVAFIDFEKGIGDQGTTNSKGEVRLSLGASSKKLQRLYVYPEKGFWGCLKKKITVTSGTMIGLDPLDLSYTDSLRYLYGNSPDGSGRGMKVAVIDTGIDTIHLDLHVDGGMNAVLGEDPNDFGPNGSSHGTHVAGIIAGRGKPPSGLRGLAPAVMLRSYRVFGKNADGASNYDIIKAIDQAAADGCDLINMSLGGGPSDDAMSAAIEEARAKGCLVIVAAGNEYRSPVSFPAFDPLAIAVSAMGRRGTFPKDSTEAGDIAPPYGKDRNNFIAAFSNIGLELDLTGPGVGVLSTVRGGYAAMSGTSMACPAVTGFAAKMLSMPGHRNILSMPRGQARSDAMAQALLQAAKSLGFGPRYEGKGLPL